MSSKSFIFAVCMLSMSCFVGCGKTKTVDSNELSDDQKMTVVLTTDPQSVDGFDSLKCAHCDWCGTKSKAIMAISEDAHKGDKMVVVKALSSRYYYFVVAKQK